jgi:tRNA (guanosine-2'-O-)-methyltransferase
MRRHTPGVLPAREMLAARIARAEADDAEKVIRTLEPFVLERRRQRLLEVIAARLESVTVLFDAPHDPHNGAAVVRSCEAFGVQFVHVVERVEHFLAAPSVARGAQKWVDVVTHTSAESAIAAAKQMDLELVSTHPAGELLPADLAKLPRVAIVLGNERDGIGDDLARACTTSVRVPMRGFIESLNVSVTAAILLAAATEGRPGDLEPATFRRLYARGLYYSVDKADEVLAGAGLR